MGSNANHGQAPKNPCDCLCKPASVSSLSLSLSGPFVLEIDLTFSPPGQGQPLLSPLQLWAHLEKITFPQIQAEI